jgi:hypothetical protein
MRRMEPNLRLRERIIRAVVGAALLGVGLFLGRLAWWGIAIDFVGSLLLFSSLMGFCHVKKVVNDLIEAGRERPAQ